jgi:methylenetetrahydrofolate dehydrogenase (NADP+)/methenyltetrahydrofolate cyclohydrolase
MCPHIGEFCILKWTNETPAVLVDAATSESNGELVGDADPACAPKCALFTPVPGGVGPVAVACLFQNAVLLAERSDATYNS